MVGVHGSCCDSMLTIHKIKHLTACGSSSACFKADGLCWQLRHTAVSCCRLTWYRSHADGSVSRLATAPQALPTGSTAP